MKDHYPGRVPLDSPRLILEGLVDLECGVTVLVIVPCFVHALEHVEDLLQRLTFLVEEGLVLTDSLGDVTESLWFSMRCHALNSECVELLLHLNC